jgi:cytidylate kinase
VRRMTVTVDGPAGSGKSTVSREVAQRLGFLYIDTGAMYRAAALKARRKRIAPDDEMRLRGLLKDTKIEIVQDGDHTKVLLDGADVSAAIRTEEAGMDASTYSRSPAVRERLVQLQRVMGKMGGVVMEGRDIGTVVFPQAECKFYLDANPEERAKRRAKELKAPGVSFKKVLEQVK